MTKEGQIIRERDEEVGKKMFGDRIFESKSVKRAVSWGAAALTAVSLFPGSMGAETENSDNPRPNKKIEIKGEMPSQKLLENETAGGGGGETSEYITLEPGYNGPEVAELKQRMFELGYYKKNTVNESYTTNTAEYVKKFEELNGLPVDGIADPEMQSLFFSDKARKADGSLVVPVEVVDKPETILIDAEEERIIDARFKSFLEGEGIFSEKELSKRTFYPYVKDKLDLGFLGLSRGGYNLIVQGVLLENLEFSDRSYLVVGVKDRDKNRKIVLIEWPMNEKIAAYSFVDAERVNKTSTSIVYTTEFFLSKDAATTFLDIIINDVVLFNLLNFNGSAVDNPSFIKASEEIKNYILNYAIPAQSINNSFVSNLLVSSKDEVRKFCDGDVLSMNITDINNEIVGLSSYSDVIQVLTDKSFKPPKLNHITYRPED